MLKQTIIWTALPHASDGPNAAGTKLRLSAFVSPRLWSDDAPATTRRLDDYDDFLDWPLTVSGATFEVEFEGGPTLPATVVATKPLRSDIWKSLFKIDTLVIPFRFRNLSDAVLESFPSLTLHEVIKGVYQDFGTKGTGADLPHRDDLGDHPTLVDIARPFDPPKPGKPGPAGPPVMVGGPKPPLVIEPVEPAPTPTPTPSPDGCCGCGCLAWPLYLVRRFLKWIGLIALMPIVGGPAGFGPLRFAPDDGGAVPISDPPLSPNRKAFEDLQKYVSPTSAAPEPMPSEDELESTYDFHAMVSTLGDYPNLLRYCGLVIDLEVELTAPVPNAATVKVIPTIPLTMTTEHASMRTHYELAPDQFVAQSEPVSGELRNGLLRVDDTSRFQVLQLDVAGGAIKLQNTATAVVHFRKDKAPGNEPEEQGLPALQTAGLSLVRPGFAAQLQALFKISEGLNNFVAAKDGSSPPTAVAASDEQWAENIQRGYRVDVFDDKSNQWHSLCRRIGTYTFEEGALVLTGEEDEGFIETAATEPVKESTTTVLRVHESLFTWSGWSMAAPRVGQTILPDPGEETVVGPPPNDPATQFKLQTLFTPKPKSLPRLRYGYGYRMRVRTVDLAGNSVFTPDDAAFSVTQAEVTPEVRYRRFEPVTPPMVMLQKVPIEGESLERIVVRSKFDDPAATIEAQESTRHIIPPKTSQVMAEQHRKFDGSPTMMSDLIGYRRAAREAGSITESEDPLTGVRTTIPGVVYVRMPPPPPPPLEPPRPDHEYWLQTNDLADSFDLTYLPDPYARGVLLMGLPGLMPEDVIDPAGGIVNKIPFEGLWPDLKPFRLRIKGIAAGVAPQTPAWDPAQRRLTVELPQGETYNVRISSYFTPSDLQNMAVWAWLAETGVPALNVIQDHAEAGRNVMHLPFRTLVLVHATQQPLAIPELAIPPVPPSPPRRTVVGQTLATVTGSCKVDAKSTEKFDLHAEWTDSIDDLSQPGPGTTSQKMHVAQIKAENPKVDAVPFSVEHAVGDTKYHAVTYNAVASTRFREYFPTAITDEPLNLIRPTVAESTTPPAGIASQLAEIPNSARPAAPKLQYLVPAFAWNRKAPGGGIFTTRRRGGGLRVYLDRPWYSSGDNELLGVVLRPAGALIGSPQAEALKKYTSEWGMDPIWPAAETPPLTPGNFADVVTQGTNVLLAELNERVDVVGYKPEFDAARGLWYCDLLIEPATAYFPMVKLALVRFQPVSVDGAHISAVIPADFIQVVPNRDVTYDASQLDVDGTLTVEVSGPTYHYPQLEDSGVSEMVLRLEQRSAIDADGELGWEPILTERIPSITRNRELSTWRTTVTVAPRPTPLRIVVLELERYAKDNRLIEGDPLRVLEGVQLPAIGNVAAGGTFLDLALGYRVTFADAVET